MTLMVDITERCNLDCRYCFKGQKKGRHSISLAVFQASLGRAWHRLVQDNKFNLGLMGGEPFANFPRLKEIISYVHARAKHEGIEFTWGATSNLTLLTKPMVAFVEETHGNIQSSIDGDAGSHNCNRPTRQGGPSFDRVIKNLPLVKRVGNKVARATITPETVGKLVENISFLATLGFQHIAAFSALENMRWEKRHFKLMEEQTRLLCELRQTELAHIPRLSPFDEYLYYANWPTENKAHHCGACRGLVAMDVHGRFWPCHRFASSRLAEWEILSFKEQGKQSLDTLRHQLKESLSSKCLDCPIFGPCRGGCWAQNLSITGRVADPAPEHCKLAEAMFRGARTSGVLVPHKEEPRTVPISGEGSCVFLDICTVCDCESCGNCDSHDGCKCDQFCEQCVNGEGEW